MIHADVAVVLPKARTNEGGWGGGVTRTSFGITHTPLPYVFRDALVCRNWGIGIAVGASEVKMG